MFFKSSLRRSSRLDLKVPNLPVGDSGPGRPRRRQDLKAPQPPGWGILIFHTVSELVDGSSPTYKEAVRTHGHHHGIPLTCDYVLTFCRAPLRFSSSR
jgi:hypothetical protein